MIDPVNLPAAQSKCSVLQRIRNVLSAASRVKLLTTAMFITLISTAGLAWASHPICGRVLDLVNKVVDLTDELHLKNGDLQIDFLARPGSNDRIAGNRDP